MTITSPQNQKLKEIRKLRQRRRWRERSGRFVAEGEDLLAAADLAGLTIALVPGQGVPLHDAFPFPPTPRDKKGTLVDLAQGVTLLIGAEREGLPHDIVDNADLTAHIPIATDSLNAAMAVTIALYELRIRMARG